ncbi:MAG: MBL fold metallo-hydrolase [Spirochaetales bacterium]|nr:MBL fold metallo-hydrolase [Spirochaetales bacterium]
MTIKIWGSRGSLPTPEPYAVRYGGNTTCIEIRFSCDIPLIIDAGSGIRKLGNLLLKDRTRPKELYLYLTHAHWDHLMGFPFFTPAYMKGTQVHVRGGVMAKRSLEKFLSKQMEAPYFPVDFKAMKAKFDFTRGKPEGFEVGEARITPIPLSHPNGGWGCKIEEAGKTFVFLTDNELGHTHEGGLTTSGYVEACAYADLVIHDAQYTEEEYKKKETWGHSTYTQATMLALSAKVKQLGFFHHDPERSDDSIDALVARARHKIETENRDLACFAVEEGQVITL